MLYNHTNLFHDNSGSTTAIAPGTTQGTTEITTTPSNTAPSSTPQNGATTTTAPQQEAPSSTPSSTPSYSNTTVYAYSGDVFPDSSSRYLTSTEVKALSSTNRSLARNEIYARHGYHFKSGDLWSHFYGTGHYTDWGKSEDAAHSEFNAYEKANVKLIKSIEKS